MWIGFIAGAAAGAGLMAHAVRGRSSTVFGPSVWRGPSNRPAIALTFDDGPSEATPEILDVLARHGAQATFFQCGANVRRLPQISRQVAQAGHELGNHTDSHPRFDFRSRGFMSGELKRAQRTILDATGAHPRFYRAPYGVRWFGLRQVQRELSLLGAMWTVLGLDWKLPAGSITARLLRGTSNGSILCLHDGRELQPRPDARATVEAVRAAVPELQGRGFEFVTLSELIWPTKN